MGVRIGSGTLGESFEEHGVVFLWSKTSYADEQKIVVAEALSCSPILPRGLRPSIAVRRNTVRDHATFLNSVQALNAERYFCRDADRYDSVFERITLNKAGPRLNLALR